MDTMTVQEPMLTPFQAELLSAHRFRQRKYASAARRAGSGRATEDFCTILVGLNGHPRKQLGVANSVGKAALVCVIGIVAAVLVPSSKTNTDKVVARAIDRRRQPVLLRFP